VLDILGKEIPGSDERERPDAVTIPDIISAASAAGPGFLAWITDRKNRRAIPHKMEGGGYVPVRHPGRKEGNWIVGGNRLVVYAKESLPVSDRLRAVEELSRGGRV
jgi:hypothetical protein